MPQNWISRATLAHHDVVFARVLLYNLGYKTAAERATLKLQKNSIMGDLRIIDMYEAATRNEVSLRDRKGNWVQKYVSSEDAALFAQAQFHRIQEVQSFIEEQFKDYPGVSELIEKNIKK